MRKKMTLDERTLKVRRKFDERYVVDDDGHWIWIGPIQKNGYGTHYDMWAHRYSYSVFVGPLVPGMQIDHLCRTPLCVNPAHLEQVTPALNVARGTSPGANAVRTDKCKRGHELIGENVGFRSDGTGRYCVECSRLRARGPKGVARGTSTTCPNGHQYTSENVYIYPDGRRSCRVCRTEGARRYRDKHKRGELETI